MKTLFTVLAAVLVINAVCYLTLNPEVFFTAVDYLKNLVA